MIDYITHFFCYKQHCYKQRKAEIGKKKTKQTLSNTLRLNFCYLKTFHILHSRYHPKIIGRILKISKRTIVPAFMRLYDPS